MEGRVSHSMPIVSRPLPSISIITPALNHARFLPQAVESVLRQDYPHLEYIVVDGGSTDDTLEVLKRYGNRLRWISEPDTGQSNAINKGFRMARGEIVAWINADDILLAGAASKAAAAFAGDPDLGMVYGDGFIIDEDGRVKSRFSHSEPFDLWRLIHAGDYILQQTAFLRKTAVEQVGYLNESLHWGMDWDLFIRLGKKFRVRWLDEPMGCIREYGTTKTSTGGFRRFRELARIMAGHAGRRFVPAYFSYGLDTCNTALRPPGGMWGRAFQALHAAAGRRIWPRVERCQGWHPEGWAGPRLHLLFPAPPPGCQVKMEGDLPLLSSRQQQQVLSVRLNGKPFLRTPLYPGPFCLTGSLPDGLAGAETLRLDLIASARIGRRAYGNGSDPVAVCYRLERVQIAGGSPAAAIFTAEAPRPAERRGLC
jgi:hypothetical protein